MGGFSQYTQPEDTPRWRPALIAGIVAVIVIAMIYALSRHDTSVASPPTAAPAYASSLRIGDLHLSTAENFVGGSVTYLDGKIVNDGSKIVTAAQVEVIFRNALGETVDRQTQALRIEAAPLGHPDWVALNVAPLAPGQIANFRLTFEHISADWNQGYPEITFVGIETK